MSTTVFERQRPSDDLIDAALAPSRHGVFWLDDVPPAERPALTGAHQTDLAIVGGGYTGLWTAIRAKERNPELRVTVVEAKRVGWAASGRNGGFCEASLTHGELNGEQRWPKEMPLLTRLGEQNLAEFGDTVARYSMDVDWEPTGTLSVAVEPHQVEWLAEEPGFLDAEQVRQEVNSPTYLAGAWDRHGTVMVHPAKLVSELARVAEELGVEIFAGSPVRAIRSSGGSHQLEIGTSAGGSGELVASQVALATNAFPSLLKRNRLMTVPVYDYALMTEPLTDEQLARIGWGNRQGIADLANQFHYYRISADNRILFGGYDAIFHAGGRIRSEYEDRTATYRTLASHFLTTFPQLDDVRFSHRWGGVIDTCSQFCAFFGTARGGSIAYAAGFTGLGVGATRFAGDVILDLLAGESTERTELTMVRRKPMPFPPEPAAGLAINTVRALLNRADHREGKRDPLLKTLDAVGLGFDS